MKKKINEKEIIKWYIKNRDNIVLIIFTLLFALIGFSLIVQSNEIRKMREQNQRVKDRLIQVEVECKLYKENLQQLEEYRGN